MVLNKGDGQQRTVLSWAAAKSHLELLTYFLENGSDPYKMDLNGESALHATSMSRKLIHTSMTYRQKNMKAP